MENSTENNYQETDLGNVSPNPRGEYSPTAKYEFLDLVSYQGGSYICLAELGTTVMNVAPVAGKNTDIWQLLTSPGALTAEYVAMHDDVVNKAKQVESSRAAVEQSQQEIEVAQMDMRQLHSDTTQAAQQATDSRDSAAGYASAAEQSRKAAKESEENVNAQINTFDTHVAEKTQESEQAIADARQQAVQTVAKQGELSVQAVKNETAEYIEEKKNTAKEEINRRADEKIEEMKQAGKPLDASVEEAKKINSQLVTNSQSADSAETKRITAENSRKEAETKRASAETERKQAEEQRAQETEQVIINANKATEAAQNVAEKIKTELAYKHNTRLVPVQFETVLGYYSESGFENGKKEWEARLMRVSVKKGDRYLYHGYCDNEYGVSILSSDFSIIRQIHVPKNEEFEIDVDINEDAVYIDFYSGSSTIKTYVLKYDKEDANNDDVGKIFIDASTEIIETYDKYFTPTREEFVNSNDMILKSITQETDAIYRFSFTAFQAASAYIDEFCIVTNNNYQNGAEVFYENVIAFVPAGKTLRINDYNSDIHTSKFEKLISITEQYINKKIPIVPSVVDIVKNKNMNPVTSNAVYQAIQSSVVNIQTELPFVAVASSEAPTAIKSVCQFVCDGTDDNIEIQSAINSLASTGGKVFLVKGKFFISAPINTGDTLVELCGEGALLDLREDTLNSQDRGGTILQAVGNTDLLHIGGAKGTTIHDLSFFGYGRNKTDNTSYGIRFTGYADTDRIYNCGFTNCAVAIGADTQTDVLYIHNLSVQRNKVGICLYRSDAEVHDCLFCENIGMENVSWDNKTYNINCADICVNDGKIYNNTFRRSGMCYDIYKIYMNESGLESDDVRPVSSIVLLGCAKIIGNYFFDQIYANCIRVMSRTDFIYIEGNSFTKWGRAELEDDSRKSAICFDAGSVLGTIMNNRFYSDSNTEKFTDKYAIYENNTDGDNSYWRYSNTYMNNFIGNLTADTENKCRIAGTASQNQFINNVVVNR